MSAVGRKLLHTFQATSKYLVEFERLI